MCPLSLFLGTPLSSLTLISSCLSVHLLPLSFRCAPCPLLSAPVYVYLTLSVLCASHSLSVSHLVAARLERQALHCFSCRQPEQTKTLNKPPLPSHTHTHIRVAITLLLLLLLLLLLCLLVCRWVESASCAVVVDIACVCVCVVCVCVCYSVVVVVA